jgi:hypothetical protein
MNTDTDIVTVEVLDLSTLEAQDRAQIDIQIATAKKYPRNLARVKEDIMTIASMDDETAKSCWYSLPRGGKSISGPSVHLARIVYQQYGNIRVESKVCNIDKTHVTGQATCIDLQKNVGVRVEVKRSITGKLGTRFNEDMITVTGNAAAAIALRNAVYNVVPKPMIDAGKMAAQERIIGDISDETKLLNKRQKALDIFQKDYGVDESAVLKVLGLRETTQIKGDELKLLFGLYQALKDGDTTVDETFYPEKLAKGNEPALEDLQFLFEAKKGLLSEKELENATRILEKKETASYNKLKKTLESK